jgi:hypothetical protein
MPIILRFYENVERLTHHSIEIVNDFQYIGHTTSSVITGVRIRTTWLARVPIAVAVGLERISRV